MSKSHQLAKKISIAIIAGQLVVGGAERQLYLWLANLDRDRFDPVVLTLHPGHDDFWEKPIRELGIPLFEIPQRANRLARLWQIVMVLRSYKPSLIHGWHVFSGVYAGLAAKMLGAKSLAGIRSSFLHLKSGPETKLMRKFCDAVIANSQAAASDYQEGQRSTKQKVFVVQNAVENNFLDREVARAELIGLFSLAPDSIWLVSIGRMDPLKRFDTLIRVCSELNKSGFDYHLVLIGDGPEREKLMSMVKGLGLSEQVTFTGEVPDASRWLPAFDVFCFPSIAEGSPNVVMEAALAGLPIAAWDLPFNREILSEPKFALLAEAGNVQDMLDALVQLITSESLRKNLGTAAQEHIRASFSLYRYIDSMTAVYENILDIK